jgi:hypothetical protein
MMKLLLHNYEDELARLAEQAMEIKVTIAFLTEGGLSWLPADRVHLAQFVVGIDLGITKPDALRTLQQQGATVMVFSEPGRLFHPKVIYLRAEDTETLIIGSNNLTSGGISSNHEISVAVPRNEATEAVFGDFLGYFESLKAHACCGIPDEKFYETYKPTTLRRKLADQLRGKQTVPLRHPTVPTFKIEDKRIYTVGDFLRLLAEEYRKLERRIDGTVKNHPLKVLNDEEFRPLFTDLVTRISKGRMTAHAQLTIGGQWYRIPNILAVNEDREPWDHTHSRGRLVLQIHFADNFAHVFQSVVLQYNLHRSLDAGEMPPHVAERYRKHLQHVEHASTRATLDLPVFKHWNYKDEVLWGKPIISFDYPIDSLPSDETFCSDLEFLANIVNGASAIS